MRVIINDDKKNIKPYVEVGDVIKLEDFCPCIVAKIKDDKIIGISFDGHGTFNGYETTLNEIQKDIDNNEVTLYKQDEWELVLQRK